MCCRGYFRGCCWGFAECVEAGVAGVLQGVWKVVLQGVSIMILKEGVLQGCYRGVVGGIAWFIKYDTVRSCYRECCRGF